MKKSLYSAFALAIAIFSLNAHADIVADRKKAFKDIKEAVKKIKPVADGKVAFDKAAFEKNAADLVELGKKPWDLFPAGSNIGKSEALPDIWSKADAFKAANQKFQDATVKLSDAAKTGNLDVIKPATSALLETCKACHKDFKKRD